MGATEKIVGSEFLELSVFLKEPLDINAEIVTAFLSEYPFDVFENDGNMLRAFGVATSFENINFKDIDSILSPYTSSPISKQFLAKENWNELWETNYFQPIVVDNKVRLRASFQKPDESIQYDLVIQPKMSFGTGHHSTTQLMIHLMLKHESIFKHTKILDMGAGTGILSIVSEKLGASRIDAVDIEDWAAENIVENADLNLCKNITAYHGDAGWLTKSNFQYDVILANIHKQVLISDAETYKGCFPMQGFLFLSGFYEADLPDIQRKYQDLGFTLVEHQVLNDWCACVLKLS